ncbi:MAG: DNA-binding transcriptional regulator, partial [Clostridia bacterium]|nr:DNA-binding transcriptional regulator [Clostridia bacterium]
MCLENEEECRNFLEDLCTIKEIMDISQRLVVAKQLNKGISYNEISKRTG